MEGANFWEFKFKKFKKLINHMITLKMLKLPPQQKHLPNLENHTRYKITRIARKLTEFVPHLLERKSRIIT